MVRGLGAGAGVGLTGTGAAAGFAFVMTLAAGVLGDTLPLLLMVCAVKTLTFFDLDLPPPFLDPTLEPCWSWDAILLAFDELGPAGEVFFWSIIDLFRASCSCSWSVMS